MWPSREGIDSFSLSSHFFIIMPSGRSEYKLFTSGLTYQFPIPETTRQLGTSLRRNDFWDHLCRQALLNCDWSIDASNTIDQRFQKSLCLMLVPIIPKVFVVWEIMVTVCFNKRHLPLKTTGTALRIKPR